MVSKKFISLHHMANQIIDKVSEFEIDNIEIDFIIEEELLGTAGSYIICRKNLCLS